MFPKLSYATVALAACAMIAPVVAHANKPRAHTHTVAAMSEVDRTVLQLKVRDKLLTDLKIDALPIVVEVKGETVILTGEVNREASKTLAEETAKSVEGVKHVKSHLSVAKAEKATAGEGTAVADALLETQIKTKLLTYSGPTAFLKVKVEAKNGVVSLRGVVPDQSRHDDAMRIAHETTGAKEVHDLMKIVRKG